jgi:hypothetical protein
MEGLINWVWPIFAGAASWWFAGKCRGRNAQKAFRFAAFGFWMILLMWIPLPVPFWLFFLNLWFVKIIPSILLFMAAGNSMLNEMRAQQRGEYTEKAL